MSKSDSILCLTIFPKGNISDTHCIRNNTRKIFSFKIETEAIVDIVTRRLANFTAVHLPCMYLLRTLAFCFSFPYAFSNNIH